MGVIASDEIVLTDLTDSYSLSLSSDSFTIQAKDASAVAGKKFSVTIKGYRSNVQIKPQIDITDYPEHLVITATDAKAPKLTVTLEAGAPQYGIISMDIYLDDVVFEKAIAYAIAYDGEKGDKGDKGDQGEQGDGGYVCKVTSSAGYLFHNTQINTNLTATVYYGGTELTPAQISALGLIIRWYKDGASTYFTTGTTIRVDISDTESTYTAKVEEGT